MAEVVEHEGGGKKKGKKRAKKYSFHIDMTPMVDLASLLLTFFMLTSQFSKAKVMEVIFPEKLREDQQQNAPQIDDSRAFHVILTGDNKILWYAGLADPTKESLPVLQETDYSADGIRRILLQRNKELFLRVDSLNLAVSEGRLKVPADTIESMRRKMLTDDKAGPIVLIKATDNVSYKNFVDIIDEMAITNIARYSVVDINTVEMKMVSNFNAARARGGAASNN